MERLASMIACFDKLIFIIKINITRTERITQISVSFNEIHPKMTTQFSLIFNLLNSTIDFSSIRYLRTDSWLRTRSYASISRNIIAKFQFNRRLIYVDP